MKSTILILSTFLLFQSYQNYAQNIPPNITELSGMEDQQGNTKLFYRIYSYNQDSIWTSSNNSIRIMDPVTKEDTVFLGDGYWCNQWFGGGRTVYTFDIWNNNIDTYIYTGEYVNCFEPYFYISRYDSMEVYGAMFNPTQKLIISKQNDSLVFALPNLISSDGGFNWDTLYLDHPLRSVSPFNDAVYFLFDHLTWNTSVLFKSTDSGNTYTVVDTTGNEWGAEFYYDSDSNHIYRKYESGYPYNYLKVSHDKGNAYTWQTIYSADREFYVSLDVSQSGTIYIADGKRIIKSTDYGNSYALFKQLDRNIVGIYKKPNSEKLYAATKYNILEITEDSVSVIKSLVIPGSILSYYPLKIGNKWVYDYTWVDWISTHITDIYIREVISEQLKPNGKKYFEIIQKYSSINLKDTVYERKDSLDGKIYRYSESCPGGEQFIDDLLIEIGDSTFATRYGWCLEHPPTIFTSDEYFNQWGIQGRKRNYLSNDLLTSEYSLVSGIGLYSTLLSDDNGNKHYGLKGCVIDGVLYGDTLTTGVNDETGLPNSYSLSQNYPNPFNPSTTLKFQLPKGEHLSLKVFDILGNEVATLVNEFKPAGMYEMEFSANGLTSGVYFYQLKAGEFVETKKMILLR